MINSLLKIVSGGQTGVDRGALDAAIATGTACGGWCPTGRRAEDGMIPDKYPLLEMPSANYSARTRQNVIDSDATLIIYFGELEGGTANTVKFCRELDRPCFCLDAQQHTPAQAAVLIQDFIADHIVAVLNVAGPRASKQAQAQTYTAEALKILVRLCSDPATV